MEAALKAIAEPRRREILRLVWSAERPAGEIASHFDVTHAAISQHLRVLREAGLVYERRDGRRRLYRARPESMAELRAYLEGYWDDALASLKREAEIEERGLGGQGASVRERAPEERRTRGGRRRDRRHA